MNGNNNHQHAAANMNMFELPPIRKIGPAVLPKPKNIKIQAGRDQQFVENEYSLAEDEGDLKNSNSYGGGEVSDEDDAPLPPPPPEHLLNEINNKFAKNENMPNRAKLVKIPVEIEVTGGCSTEKENDADPAAPTSMIVSTSRYKFPRKNSLNSSTSSSSTSASTGFSSMTSSALPSTQSPPPPAPPLPPVYPTAVSPAKTCTINGMRPTTINFSADAGANGRPTITITTSRGPNSPTITATTTSPTTANTFTYNIPVQHVYQGAAPTALANESSSSGSVPVSSNGGQGNFIISASSLSSLPPELFLNGSMINKPTLIANGSYVIPVSMKLMNSSPNSSVAATSSSVAAAIAAAVNNTNRNNSSGSSGNMSNGLQQQLQQQIQHQLQQHLQQQQQHQTQPQSPRLQQSSFNSPASPTSPTNLGNIVIKTTTSGGGGGGGIGNLGAPQMGSGRSGRQRVEDEVDLLKDLLSQNLNSAKEPNFYGVCTRCNEKVVGAENGLRAMDNVFHVTCFVCYGCGIQLQGHHFYAMENRSFCENCYMRLLERCSLCSKPITDRILRATGKPFHPECFCCIACKKNLDGIPFTVDASNKIHCIECFHEKYAPRCYICHLPITPDPGQEETVRIVAMDQSFHVNCYKCEECGASLSSNSENAGGCFPLDDHIYCKSCHMKLIRSLGNGAGLVHPPSSPLNKFLPSNQAPRSTDL